MRPYLIHQDKMWFVISGCRVIAIVADKAEGMQVMRDLPARFDEQSLNGNGAGPSGGE
jgi:hypothetical protein